MTDRTTLSERGALAGARGHTRRIALAGAAAVALTLSVFAPSAGAQTGPGCQNADTTIGAVPRLELQRSVVCLINHERTERRLPRLRLDARLNRAAQSWTNLMVLRRDFGHGVDVGTRISAVGYDWSIAGENVATGFRTPASVVAAWMASPGHCRNILSPSFADVGVGVSDHSIPGFSSQAGTWTQDFGLPMGLRAPSTSSGPAAGCPYAG